MSSPWFILMLIAASALLTYLLRFLPLAVLRGQRMRPTLERLLRNMPVGILTALVTQSVFLKNGQLTWGLQDYQVHGLVATLALAVATRRIGLIVFGGLAIVGLLNWLG